MNVFMRRLCQHPLDEVIGSQVPMARSAIQAVERHMFVKTWHPHKPLQRRRPHPFDILEPHVVRDQGHNLLRILIRKPEPATDLLAHPLSYACMTVEPDPVPGLRYRPKSRRLANVMQ